MKVDEEAEDMAGEKECDHCWGVSWCIAIEGGMDGRGAYPTRGWLMGASWWC